MARRVAEDLRGQGDEETARLTEAAADRAERLSGYLRDSDGDRFLRDIEGFARRRPMVAATAGFLVGLAASRFVKASAERRALSTNGDAVARRDTGTRTSYSGAVPPPRGSRILMAYQQRNGLHEQPLGELLKRLSNQVSTLARQEVELAKAELAAKGRVFGRAAGFFGAAALLALCGLGALTALLILALDEAMPAWAAALVVTVLMLALAGAFALLGKRRIEEAGAPVPKETIESTKEDIKWAKTQLQSGRR